MNVQKLLSSDYRSDWRGFAKELFKYEEADPGYMLLKRAELPYEQKLRYVLAWCTYYNPGIAAIASQYKGEQFYEYLRSVYTVAQRASERRHFRGQAGLKALDQWQQRFPRPEDMIEACQGDTYLQVRKNMSDMAQMGDYFYWKLADIWDTVFDEPVDFTGCERYMPKVPKQGAEIIYDLELTQSGGYSRENNPNWMPRTIQCIEHNISKLDYPVKGGRKLALQEAETVCCVFKQHVHGDYRLGFRSAKAWKRLLGMHAKAPKVIDKLCGGLYAGGIWTPKTLADVVVHL